MSYHIYLTLIFLFLSISFIDSCQWSPTQCGCAKTPPSLNTRIVGGVQATPHSWPWIVSIRYYGSPICGGALINDRFVLTAAHCFPDYYYSAMISFYSFAMGHHNRYEKQLVLQAKRITRHAQYDYNGRSIHDIALVELEQTVDFNDDRLGFICLPLKHINDGETYPSIGTKTWVVGWGRTSFEGQPSEKLLQVSVPITNNAGCKQSVTDPKTQVCAGFDHGGKDSCLGDSGGPLMVETQNGMFELVGIVSFGIKCAEYMKPGIYTRVAGYINWINSSSKEIQPDMYNSNNNPGSLQGLFSSTGDHQKISFVLICFMEILFFI